MMLSCLQSGTTKKDFGGTCDNNLLVTAELCVKDGFVLAMKITKKPNSKICKKCEFLDSCDLKTEITEIVEDTLNGN